MASKRTHQPENVAVNAVVLQTELQSIGRWEQGTSVKPQFFVLLVGMLANPIANAAQPGIPRPSSPMLAHACAGCHGPFGHSRGATPSIHGKPEAEFIRLMREFKSGQRPASVMNRIAPGYTDEDFKALAEFYKDR